MKPKKFLSFNIMVQVLKFMGAYDQAYGDGGHLCRETVNIMVQVLSLWGHMIKHTGMGGICVENQAYVRAENSQQPA